MSTTTTPATHERIAFIGGGNMAGAIIGGLVRQGHPADRIAVVEPWAEARAKLLADYGVAAEESAGPRLKTAAIVVWAVKPQMFKAAAAPVRAQATDALHLSVAAGIRSDSIAQWLGTERVVRAMPNTPALVGKGMTALFARPGVAADDRARVEAIVATTGEQLWVAQENSSMP